MTGGELTPDVVVVGGGPAGLTAAAGLRAAGVGEVLVLDREAEAGGIPRHSDHTGYGVRDLHRLMRGPAYARALTERALEAGAVVHTRAMATGWTAAGALAVTSPEGLLTVRPRALVLATGARERPRPARWVPGDRPPGVLTTGQLQNLVHLHRAPIGSRAVVVGGEPVSWSAVLTLREAGCRTVLMTSQWARSEGLPGMAVAGRVRYGVRLARRTRVTRVIGRDRVTAVEIEELTADGSPGPRREVPCDTVVFTGDWIPDHELARLGGLDLDAGSLAPVVDTCLHTSRQGVFAAGNLLHPVDTADVAAIDGRHVAAQVARWLDSGALPGPALELRAGAPLRWVAPGRLRPGDPGPPRDRLLAWSDAYVRRPTVTAVQDGRPIGRRRLPWPAAPGRAFRLPWALVSGARPDAGPVDLVVST